MKLKYFSSYMEVETLLAMTFFFFSPRHSRLACRFEIFMYGKIYFFQLS